MAEMTIQYDDGRPVEVQEAAQFIIFHVPPSAKEKQFIMTAQCSVEFVHEGVTEENAGDHYKQAFKAMSQKWLGN